MRDSWIITETRKRDLLFIPNKGDSDDELLDEEPDLDTAMLNHSGGVNRIRVS